MRVRIFTALVVICLIAALPVQADHFIKQKKHTDAYTIMGQAQPASDEETVMWIGKDRMAMGYPQSNFIVRLDQKKLYMINHKDKTYSVMDLPIDFSKLIPEEMKGQMEQMMAAMQMKAKVTPTDEKKKIKDWNCRRYDVEVTSQMMQMKMSIWATKDISLDYKAFMEMSSSMAGLQMGMDQVMEEMKKIDGFQVLQETTMTMMGTTVNSREELVSLEEKDPPAGVYDPPKDYTLKELSFPEMMQQMRNK
jgi:hypothetical protein